MDNVVKSDALSPSNPSWFHGTWGDGEGRTVVIVCPKGHQSTLRSSRDGMPQSTHHTIAPDGKVSPSVVCPRCDYHEFVRLLDWAEPQSTTKEATDGQP